MSLLVFGSVIAFCYGMMVEQWALIGANALVFLVSLIGLVFVAQPPLRIVKHNDGQFWIRGCSDAFLRDLTEGTS